MRHKALSLGEVLDGDRMAESLYNIRFKENTERQTLCQLTLSEKEVWFDIWVYYYYVLYLKNYHIIIFLKVLSFFLQGEYCFHRWIS